MGCTRIKQYDCRLMINREYTGHNWCTLRKFSKSGKVDLPLFDLHDLLFTFALIVLIRILTLGRLLVSGTIPGEVRRTSTGKATIVTIHMVGLLKAWPWPRLLLLRHRRSSCSLLLGGLKTHLPDGGFLCGALGTVLCTKRYRGGCALEGPVGAFLFFSARCAVMQSS